MKTKALFLILFIPVHSLVTLLVLQRMFNPPPGGGSIFFKIFSVGLASPVLLPLVAFDPDGDRLPRWLQVASFPLNSLVWALALLMLFSVAKRLAGRRTRSK
ncbi:MAG: hypothetical protein HYY24_19205 [Verrucomicrobia bacterium]|nr:hypothetical protein [Verrucomicrobiota bacterium]